MNPFSAIGNIGKQVGDTAGQAFTFARKLEATGRNGVEVLRYGGFKVDPETSPFEIVASSPMYRLRRYFPDDIPSGLPALVLVPPLMIMAEVYDVAPKSSSVRAVHEWGIDVWVVDFGRPEEEPGGLQRSVTDHVLALSDVVDTVREITGRDVVLSGYSQGGMFAYQTAAYRRGEGLDSLITFGAPVDFRAAPMPLPISTESFIKVAEGLLNTGLLDRISLPGWFMRNATRLLDPVKNVQFEAQYYRQIHDRDKLLPGEQQRQFLSSHGWTAYSGPAMAELFRQFLISNRMLEGGLIFGDRTVTLADIECPIMIAVGEEDREGHPLSARGITRAAPRACVYELMVKTGHFGVVAGGRARKHTWPRVADWIRWRAGEGELPESIVPADESTGAQGWSPTGSVKRLQSSVDLGVGVARAAVLAVGGVVDAAKTVVRERGSQVPLLNRLDALQPATAISLGLLLDEAAKRDPEGVALFYGDRVLRQHEVKRRVDNIVRGLISVGVRQGDRVGVLMSSRPSCLTVLAAISRLGAIAVLLRPDGNVQDEARLGEIAWLVSDPERALEGAALPAVTWCVLGGGGVPRELPEHVVDMERIDPDKVALPEWYRPNPRRGGDVAFVLFSGTGARTRSRVITNRRWAISALGTASAAALKPADTVYSATPLHHSSALLMAVGGAIVAGSRLALASGTDPDTFWDEVRRYGASHVSYTWTSLRHIASGPVHINERNHSIKMFFGSGMPPNLWRRINHRFAPAHVLEFYASADGEAILANVAASKIGSAGRPLPRTAEVRIAAFDPNTRKLAVTSGGWARECRAGEAGLLMARFDLNSPARRVQHDVFEAGDAWQATGDMFLKDTEGDFWLVGAVDSMIHTDRGWVSPNLLRNALNRISSVDLAVVYGEPHGDTTDVVAAVTLFEDSALSKWDLDSAMREIEPDHRPREVRVVPELPVTTTFRPLRQEADAAPIAVWRLSQDGREYGREQIQEPDLADRRAETSGVSS